MIYFDIFDIIVNLCVKGQEFCVVIVFRIVDVILVKVGVKVVVFINGEIVGYFGGVCVQWVVCVVVEVVLDSG